MRFLFIGGAGRSGTSMLQDLLCIHPQIVGGPELNFTKKIMGLRADMIRPFYLRRNQAFYDAASLDEGIRRFYESLFARLVNSAPQVSFVSEKTPDNIDVMSDLLGFFPDSKFLFMYRDGRDVVASRLRVLERAKRTDSIKLEAARSGVKGICRRWKQTLEIRRQLPSPLEGRVMDVRYETLVSEPQAVLRAILGFLGLEGRIDFEKPRSGTDTIHVDDVFYTKELREQPVSDKNIGKWRKELGTLQKAYVQLLLARHLKRMGYPVPSWALAVNGLLGRRDR